MQTVPSLVGTGTAIAAAASGLVFGQPTDLDLNLNHQAATASSRGARVHKRSISIDRVLPARSYSPSRTLTPPSRRPATSSAAPRSIGSELHAAGTSIHQTTRPPLSRRQRPQTSQVAPSSTSSRRQSLVVLSQGDIYTGIPVVEGSRESISSSGSWLKRLSSIRPLSQHGSPRSSILADSPSVSYSYGSAAPILSRSGSVSKPMPPNKLVKRSPSRNYTSEELAQRKSKGHLPTLRRPATSHQRSATLQQFRAGLDVAGSSADAKYSLDEPICPEELLGASPIEELGQSPRTARAAKTSGWVSFFHSKTASLMTKPSSHTRLGGSGDGGDAASSAKNLQSKRINPARSMLPGTGAHLIKPRMVSGSSTQSDSFASSHIEEEPNYQLVSRNEDRVGSPTTGEMVSGMPPSSRPRRSFSSTFSQTANWASKTSGSLRRTKRGATQGSGENKRHVSAPVRALPSAVGRVDTMTSTPIAPVQQGLTLDSAATFQRPAPKRNASSPLPPLSNLPGLHAELSRRSPVGGVAGHSIRLNQPSGSSTSSTSVAMTQRRGSHYERLSALDSSDGDARDLISGDEYDTDFKSDTLFDSLRTMGSGRVRAVETPLESVYDESPPSTGGNKRSKRLSIQEILDRTWDEDGKIMEEDESNSTPVHAPHRSMGSHVRRELREDPRFGLDPLTSNEVARETRNFGRFSLDDDFDEDWTRDDDDAPVNALSPPSKGSSLSSSGINPNVRLALASIGGNLNAPSKPRSSSSERPLSNLFDWSEPTPHDKQNPACHSRPKTAYAKQEIDSRGGRPVVRKGPMPAHVRSQSVPVVHDLADESKPAGSKYGTWGLGSKTVSEDWDEDFEFGGLNDGPGGKDHEDLFAVPESIRASQPSVKAHSGQIRELSLLVNDLKRLCRHGRELNMLNGEQKPFWKEAEGIIALASPDEGSANEDGQSEASIYMDAFEAANPPGDEVDIDDNLSFDRLDAVIERNEPVMSKTAVVRERQSPRRRSVFSPDDDIFGANWPLSDDRPRSNRPSRPRTPENPPAKLQDVDGVVRSVIESVQYRSTLATAQPAAQGSRKRDTGPNRMHFDTNSLKLLVRRAGELRDILSDLIRRADQLTQSPARTPRHERRLDSSPAFTRVFDDPGSSPARRPVKSRGNSTTIVERPSSENSPPSSIGRRVPLMTVN
ncbi:hypothetical protein MHUMG1_00589 [Metarhizium humberi]|uniref:Uncharacterized protein n=1 Tax=Metarhizium humberi TaxID=2596975 RepID=A0A9P8MJ88_9HYPO|nr:hypothetical protein MHUMG1_00589 [Metarhizium humberi]